MKRYLHLFFLLCTMAIAGQAHGASLSLMPDSLTLGVGDTADFDLYISGLGSDGAPSLGAFKLDIMFDQNILAFESLIFGPYLGDPDLSNSFVNTTTPGAVELDEVSFLPASDLDSLQPASFPLASLTFTMINLGFSDLVLENVVLSDAPGFEITVETLQGTKVYPVPVPCTFLLLLGGVAGLAGLRKKLRNLGI